MEAKFIEYFENFHKNQKNTSILCAEKYEEIIESIQSINSENLHQTDKKNKLTPKQKNWNVRYTIRYENGTAILYRDEKKIVKKEDLFILLQTTHSKLGHGGRNVMWKELSKEFTGISK